MNFALVIQILFSFYESKNCEWFDDEEDFDDYTTYQDELKKPVRIYIQGDGSKRRPYFAFAKFCETPFTTTDASKEKMKALFGELYCLNANEFVTIDDASGNIKLTKITEDLKNAGLVTIVKTFYDGDSSILRVI